MRREWRGTARLALAVGMALAASPAAAQQGRALASPSGVAEETAEGDPAARHGSGLARRLAPPDRLRPTGAPPVALGLALATYVPLCIGVDATLELPAGLLLRAHAGVTPGGYVDLINGVATGMGAYSQAVAGLVSASGGGAFVVRLSAGIRPFEGYGFELSAGYTWIDASASVSTAQLEAVTQQPMAWAGLERVGVSGQLHALHAQVGWSGTVWDHLVLRVSVGWVHTVAAGGRLGVPDELRRASEGRIEEYEATARTSLERWGFSPELGVSAGYRF